MDYPLVIIFSFMLLCVFVIAISLVILNIENIDSWLYRVRRDDILTNTTTEIDRVHQHEKKIDMDATIVFNPDDVMCVAIIDIH